MLGLKINRIRVLKGITLGQLSRTTGISKGYLSNLEKGIKANPSFEVLEKISLALDVDVLELLKEDDVNEIKSITLSKDIELIISKVIKLSKEDRKKIIKIIEVFEN